MPPLDAKRIFIAILLPDDVRSAMASLQKELQKTGVDMKWVEPHNLHITLKFLGDVQSDKIPSILDALQKGLSQEKTLAITLECLGAFPSMNAPRIVWLGSRKITPLVSRVVEKIDSLLAPLDFKKEARPFFTHATLGRVRSSQNKMALIEKINQIQTRVPPQMFTADAITLMESRLASAGPTHTPIATLTLV